MNNEFKIPFSLTEQALSNWLHGLSLEHNFESGKQLLAVLQTFASTDLTRQQLFIFLAQISAELDIIVKQLEKDYQDAGLPLESEAQAKADLVTRTYLALADHYASLGRKDLAHPGLGSRKETVTAIYLSLQAIGNALLNLAKVYMNPDEGIWLNCYQLYKMAESDELLEIEISSGEQKGGTINAIFKHLLLFELSDTKQFRPREMNVIHAALKNLVAQAEIKTDCNQDSYQNLYGFNLDQDQQPRKLWVQPPHPKNTSDRYISTLAAASKLNQFLQRESSPNTPLKSINYSFLKRAIVSLGHTQKRKFNRKKEQLSFIAIVGFNHVASYLYKINNASKEQFIQQPKKDPKFVGKWKVPDLDLVPFGDESLHQMESHLNKSVSNNSNINKILQASRKLSGSNRVWDPMEIEKNKMVDDIPTGEFAIIDSSAQGFLGLWKSLDAKVKVGNIIALPAAKGDRVEIGLIRRITRPTRDDICLGIEIIGFESEAISIFRSERKQQLYPAILLPGIPALKQADSILYNTSDFSAGEFITIRRDQKNITCRLNKLINSTAAITHMELFYSAEMN